MAPLTCRALGCGTAAYSSRNKRAHDRPQCREAGMRVNPSALPVLAGLLMLGLSAAQAEPLKIRHGWVVMGATVSPLIFEKPEVLTHYGKSYTVESIHFAGTSPQLVALATGEVDIIGLAY